MMNPFKIGGAVTPEGFMGREKELKEVLLAFQQGGSIALLGEPRIGKTSLLYFLRSPFAQQMQEGTQRRYLFHYINSERLPHSISLAQLMELIIRALKDANVIDNLPIMPTEENVLRKYMRQVFADLEKRSITFVLLIDEFEDLANHPNLATPEFSYFLRDLITEYKSTSLVITLDFNLEQAIKLDNFNKFINNLRIVHLGPFSDFEARNLLSLGQDRFSNSDIDFLLNISGNHPNLLQIAAHALWEAYEQERYNQKDRWQHTIDNLMVSTEHLMPAVWDLWSPKMREVAIFAALSTTPTTVQSSEIAFPSLRGDEEEVRELVQRGYLIEDKNTASGYRIRSAILNRILLDQLISVVHHRSTESSLVSLNNELGTSFAFTGALTYFRRVGSLNLPNLVSVLAGDSTTDAPPPKKKAKGK